MPISFAEPRSYGAPNAVWTELFDSLHGRWTDALVALGVDGKVVNKRNQPCPIHDCGGRDCFQYTDHKGDGNYRCRRCGPGRGFKLLRGVSGWPAAQAIARLRQYVSLSATKAPELRQVRPPGLEVVREVWEQSCRISDCDPVGRYLQRFGLAPNALSDKVRFHPALDFYLHQDGRRDQSTRLPAMVAAIEDEHGVITSLHRTYFEPDRVRATPIARRRMHRMKPGFAVRLAEPETDLIVTLDVESALAVGAYLGAPAWASLEVGAMEKMPIPTSVRRLDVLTSNCNRSAMEGEAAAFSLARRLKLERSDIDIRVHVPSHPGVTWADACSARHRSGRLLRST